MDDDFAQIQGKLEKLGPKYQAVCWLLARGFSQQRAADQVGLSQPRISQLVRDPQNFEFQEALDALSRYLSRLGASESLRMVRQAIAQFQDPETGELDLSNTNLLQWLRKKDVLEGTIEDVVKVKVVEFVEPKSMAELMQNL